MTPLSKNQILDRHALVMAVWLSFGLVSITLLNYGVGAGGTPFILLAFAAIFAAFIGHVIVNAVYHTTFTPRELALGLVVYATGLVAFGAAMLLAPGFGARHFLAISGGFIAIFAAVLFYMITHFGVRRVFNAFDVVSDFRADVDHSDPSWRGDWR
jgi:hypothetical protein